MPHISTGWTLPELIMGPCRDFGEMRLEDIARLPVHAGVAAHARSLVEKLKADDALCPEDAGYLHELTGTLAVAPGYVRLLSDERKRAEAIRLYSIAREPPAGHPLAHDLRLAIVLILFSISPSEKLVSSLSRLGPPLESGLLSYEYHALLALNFLLAGSPEAAASHATAALAYAPDGERRAYVKMLQACIALRSGDPDAAIRYLGCGIKGRLGALASFYAGIVRFERQEYDGALRYFQSAGVEAGGVMDTLAVRCNIGACAVNLGAVDEGEKEFDAVGRMVNKKSGLRAARRRLLASSYRGIICRVQGNYSRAEEYYKKALRECLKLNDATGIANQLGNLGILYRHTGDQTMALRLLNSCLLYSERLGYGEGIRFSCANLYAALAEAGKATEARMLKELYEARYPGLDI